MKKSKKELLIRHRAKQLSQKEWELCRHSKFRTTSWIDKAILLDSLRGWQDWYWDQSIFGKDYIKNQNIAKKWVNNIDGLREMINKIGLRARFSFYHMQKTIAEIIDEGEITEFVLICFLATLNKDEMAIWESLSSEPKFKVGDMVKLRSNAGVDSVLQYHGSSGINGAWYGCGRTQLKKAKLKSFVIVGVDPDLKGNCYAKQYSYNEKQGGCRYYKALPLGEVQTCIVVEKFLKKLLVKK